MSFVQSMQVRRGRRTRKGRPAGPAEAVFRKYGCLTAEAEYMWVYTAVGIERSTRRKGFTLRKVDGPIERTDKRHCPTQWVLKGWVREASEEEYHRYGCFDRDFHFD